MTIRGTTGLFALLVVGLVGCGRSGDGPTGASSSHAIPAPAAPLLLVVMDPLAAPLACECVQGYAQRQYDRLGEFLGSRLGRPVVIAYGEYLQDALRKAGGKPDLIIGKRSVVMADAAETKVPVRLIAMLTGQDGTTTQQGLFVVRTDDPAKTIADLKGRRILLGEAWAEEKHAAAIEALRANGIPLPEKIETSPGCASAALDVAEKEADAAVISGYAFPLLEGCGSIDKGSLHVIGKTAPVPFVTVFATARVTPEAEAAALRALLEVRQDPALLALMESRDGFVALSDVSPPAAPSQTGAAGWTDWRGPHRNGLTDDVPDTLPATAQFLWRTPLTGLGLSGVVATPTRVVVADKDQDAKKDIFRCLDADTGREVWNLAYEAADELDYSNSPRATPVVRNGLVYLLGALGGLHCVRLTDGEVVWKRHLYTDFGAERLPWGACSSPLVVDDTLIVNPGAKDASLVALDLATGDVRWKSPGRAAAYASFILGTFGGVRQIVGYDATTLGGWDPATGRRLWELIPPEAGDFNVPTPIDLGGRLLVATENNGTRIYDFDANGRIVPTPAAQNADLVPDSSTPVVLNGLVFGCQDRLVCLDAENGLKTLWSAEDDAFGEYASFIAGRGRILVTTTIGQLLLLRAQPAGYAPVSRLRLFPGADTELWAHPALVPGRLYLRTQSQIVCLKI